MPDLPTRRQGVALDIPWRDNEVVRLLITRHPLTNEIIEVFGDGPKVGSEAWALLHDICRSMSLEMRDGVQPEEFAYRATRDRENRPQSLYGVVADTLVMEKLSLVGE